MCILNAALGGNCGGQGHIIWVQRQDAFKEKFGTDIDEEPEKISNEA